jgi:hypothetical protein
VFLVRIVFWSTMVLVAAPHLGVLSLPEASGPAGAVVETVRAEMVANLERVKAELKESPVPGAGLSRS